MSKHIELPDDLFKRIQNDAVPFVDLTEIAVIKRWADYYEAGHRKAPLEPLTKLTAATSLKELNPSKPPDLLHTRVRGTFGSIAFRKWNDLVRIAHVQAFVKATTFEALRTVTHAQVRTGNHEGESGYHFVPDIGISVQGVDANHAWLYSLRLAQYCNVPVRAQVEWRHNDRAAHPGETRSLVWSPATP